MAVLIDPPAWPGHGRWWSHLVSDSSYAELHAFAAAQGVPTRAFEGDHYDVPQQRYADLVRAGARPVPSRDLLRALQVSGLRLPKRRGERVLSTVTERGVDGRRRVDLLASSLPAPSGRLVRTAMIVLAGTGSRVRVLVLPAGAAPELPTMDDPAAGGRCPVGMPARRAVSTAPPCGHLRVTPLDPPRPAGWTTYLLVAPQAAGPGPAGGGGRSDVDWLPVPATSSGPPGPQRWWPLVQRVAHRRD